MIKKLFLGFLLVVICFAISLAIIIFNCRPIDFDSAYNKDKAFFGKNYDSFLYLKNYLIEQSNSAVFTPSDDGLDFFYITRNPEHQAILHLPNDEYQEGALLNGKPLKAYKKLESLRFCDLEIRKGPNSSVYFDFVTTPAGPSVGNTIFFDDTQKDYTDGNYEEVNYIIRYKKLQDNWWFSAYVSKENGKVMR